MLRPTLWCIIGQTCVLPYVVAYCYVFKAMNQYAKAEGSSRFHGARPQTREFMRCSRRASLALCRFRSTWLGTPQNGMPHDHCCGFEALKYKYALVGHAVTVLPKATEQSGAAHPGVIVWVAARSGGPISGGWLSPAKVPPRPQLFGTL